jgi:hypothetical protein
MKQTVITFLLAIISFVCFSQFVDTYILNKSEQIKIVFASKNDISSASLAFLKFFGGKYGIQFNMIATSNKSAYIYARNMNSLTLNLNDDKQIILKPYKDTVYNLMDGTNSWSAFYFIEEAEISLLKNEQIIQIFSEAGLRIKKQTANKIYAIANSFL